MARCSLALAEDITSPFGDIQWFTQPANPKNFQARFTFNPGKTDIPRLASALAGICEAFEILDHESLIQILYVKGLGLKTLNLDASGEPVIRFGQLDQIRLMAQGSVSDYERLIRLARGQAWLDALEPLRMGFTNLDGLRRVG